MKKSLILFLTLFLIGLMPVFAQYAPSNSGGGGGSGTVTSASVVSANGFNGTVANPTTTPAITLKTTVTGITKGNGTALSAAVGDTDYQNPITLTTTGTSGAATFSGDTLNIPQYTGGSGTVTSASVVSANGLAGTVANPTTTPAITLSTTITGLLKGNGTAISAAISGTDYQAPLTLPLSIANGGTGQTQANNAFDALAPTTTEGDIIYYNNVSSHNARLAVGATNTVLLGGTDPNYGKVPLAAMVTGTNNTLIGYSGAGAPADVAIGSGLSLSSNTLSASSANAPAYTATANISNASAAPTNVLLPSLLVNGGLAPSQFSGLTGWWCADQLATASNIAEGASVTSLPDSSGNGYTMTTAASGLTAPLYGKTLCGGKPGILFDGAATGLANASCPLNKGAYTMVMVIRQDSKSPTSGYNFFMSYLSSLFGPDTSAGVAGFFYGSIFNSSVTSGPFEPGAFVIVTSYDGTTIKQRVNGAETTAAISTSGSVTGFALGYGPGGYYASGAMGEAILYNRALSSSTECPYLEQWLMQKYNISPKPKTDTGLVIFDGNSVMAGVHDSNICNNFSNYIMNLLGNNIQWADYSYSAAGTATLNARATTLIDPQYSVKRATNVLVFLEGYNDASVTNYEAYVNARLAVGWKVVLLTPPSNGIVADATRLTFNAAIRTYYNAHPTWQAGVILADTGNDPYMGLTGQKSDTTYMYSDATHPIDAGTTRLTRIHLLPALGEALGLPTINRQFEAATIDNNATWIKYIPVNTAHVYLSGAGSTAGTSYVLTLQCAGQRIDTGGTDSAYFEQRYLVNVSTSGVVTLTKVGTDIAEQTGFSAAALTATANGKGVFVQVTGENSKTVAWTLRYDIAGTN